LRSNNGLLLDAVSINLNEVVDVRTNEVKVKRMKNTEPFQRAIKTAGGWSLWGTKDHRINIIKKETHLVFY
jgi:hypothetical protein